MRRDDPGAHEVPGTAGVAYPVVGMEVRADYLPAGFVSAKHHVNRLPIRTVLRMYRGAVSKG